jgi:hypothetical protein
MAEGIQRPAVCCWQTDWHVNKDSAQKNRRHHNSRASWAIPQLSCSTFSTNADVLSATNVQHGMQARRSLQVEAALLVAAANAQVPAAAAEH